MDPEEIKAQFLRDLQHSVRPLGAPQPEPIARMRLRNTIQSQLDAAHGPGLLVSVHESDDDYSYNVTVTPVREALPHDG